MNTESYEQTALSGEELGDAAQWLSPALNSGGVLRGFADWNRTCLPRLSLR